MGLFGGIAASAVGGMFQSRGASDAADAQVEAANAQAAVQREVYQDQRKLFKPYRQAGKDALNALRFELGLADRPTFGGDMPAIKEIGGGSRFNSPTNSYPSAAMPGGNAGRPVFDPFDGDRGYPGDRSDRENARLNGPRPGSGAAPAPRYMVNGEIFDSRADAKAYANANRTGGTEYQGFQATPGYEFRLSEGINAIDRSAAASGGLFSGATMKAAQQYGEGLAASEYDAFYNRLAGMAAGGQNAAGQTGAAAQNYATGTSSALANVGNARAAGAIGQGNAINSAINNGIGIWQYQNALNGGGNNAGIFDAPWASSGFWG